MMIDTLQTQVLGQRIRQLRTRRGLTQQDLAGTDYSKSYISAIEQGKTRPSLEALQRIARRLEVPAGVLLDPNAPGFAPFDPDTMRRRVRRRRGREGGQISEPAQIDLQLARAEMQIYEDRPTDALQLLRGLVPSEVGADAGQAQGKQKLPLLDTGQLYQAYYLASKAAVQAGNPTEATGYLQKAQGLANQLGERNSIERVRNLVGEAYFRAGQPLSALEQHQQCLQAVEAGHVTDPGLKMQVYANIAADYSALRDNRRAVEAYRQALGTLEQVNNLGVQGASFSAVAEAYSGLVNYPLARLYAYKALGLSEALHNMRVAAQVEASFGDMLIETDNPDEAERYLTQSLEMAERLNSDLNRASVLTNLARVSLSRGDLKGAQQRSGLAIERARAAAQGSATGNGAQGRAAGGAAAREVLAKALALGGEIASRQGDSSEADRLFGQAIKTIEGSEATEAASDIYQRYAQVLASRGQHEQAARYFEQAYRAVARRGR